mmetsp:Transcript_28828/g.74028  ORF Transcript_28828/g.74028 Transcript_28828/m.74028 type:complete len:346 (-) Transcript_28828:940-1977(-)
MSHFLPSQHDYNAYMKRGKNQTLTDAARDADKASHAMLNKLRSLTCNSTCFDCTALKPGWAVLPHGIFVCIDCAQVHRNLGRHISQTKAINTGTYLWYPAELGVMNEVGNQVAALAFAKLNLPNKPSKDASAETKHAYAAAKYTTTKPDYVHAAEQVRDAVDRRRAPQLSAGASAPASVVEVPMPPTPLMPTLASTHVPATVLRPVSLGGTRQQTQPPPAADLIDFTDVNWGAPPLEPPPQPPVANAAGGGKNADHFPSELVTLVQWDKETPLESSAVLGQYAAMHEQKKANVLAHFAAIQSHTPAIRCMPKMQLERMGAGVLPAPAPVMTVPADNDAFFANFGL